LLTEQLYDSNIEQIQPGKMDSRERNTVIQESKDWEEKGRNSLTGSSFRENLFVMLF
jgi:hypothetical protein